MTIESIDWGKLKPFAGDRRLSFEELCYQLVEREVRGKGRLVRVDGSGGDGGVEMYLELPGGEVWGWQAKFFWPDVRLDGKHKEQIKSSLASACRSYPNLTKWTLLTPGNPTKEEAKWFAVSLSTLTHKNKTVVPSGRTIKLEHVCGSDLLTRLASPAAAGVRTYFFGDLELNLNWFARKAAAMTAHLRSRYLPDVHVETVAEKRIIRSLARPELEDELAVLRARLKEAIATANGTKSSLNDITATNEKARERLDRARTAIQDAVSGSGSALADIEDVLAMLKHRNWRAARSRLSQATTDLAINVPSQLRELRIDEYEHVHPTRPETAREEAWRPIRDAMSAWTDVNEDLKGFAENLARLDNQEWHVFAAAGYGKTHVAANLVGGGVAQGHPGILLVGDQFTTEDPLSVQIQRLLGVEHVSWDEFVGALEACADAHSVRIPIVIDGLNETTRSGALSSIWRSHLASFCAELRSKTDAVVVVTTCRDTYEEAIWDGEKPPGKLFLNSDLSYDVDEAVDRYFDYYKIVADVGSAPRTQFQHPIYLRLYCEATNPERTTRKHVVLGEESLFAVFDQYMDECNRRVARRLGLPSGARPLDAPLRKVAEALWTGGARGCALEEAYLLVEGRSREDSKESDSLVCAMEHEDLLVFRDWVGSGEVVRFTYDLMGGYLIAAVLVEAKDLADESTRDKLWGAKQHPLSYDIARCLAALAPRRLGRRLREIFPGDSQAFAVSVDVLFEIAPDGISEQDVAIVEKLFGTPANRQRLLELAVGVWSHPAHALNGELWSRMLNSLALVDRDLAWSEHVREHVDGYLARVGRYERQMRSWTADDSADAVMRERVWLTALQITWILTSTVRPLRDAATRALYWYGRRQPRGLIELVKHGLRTNDPYVSERVLAAAYGVAMARAHDEGGDAFVSEVLPALGRLIYELVFAPDAPRATTHALARDYARHTVEIAVLQAPDLLTADELRRIRPPFKEGGLREWGELEERSDDYKEGSRPIHMDFHNYTLGRLVPGRRNYDDSHPEYQKVLKQILWRLYGLGYNHDLFGVIDRSIGWGRYGRSADPGKTDRYGKKYSWIAYFELYGYRQDLGLLTDQYFGDEVRPSDVDIDPSFPETPVLDTYDVPKLWTAALDPKQLRVEIPSQLEALVGPESVLGAQGPWVLMDGSLGEEDGGSDAPVEGLVWVRSMLVAPGVAAQLLAQCQSGEFDTRSINGATDYYTFAGEVPWADTFSSNEWDGLGSEYDSETKQWRARQEAILATRDISWEDYHTETTQGRSWTVPARQIAEQLGLHAVPESWDLVDKNGVRATYNIHYGKALRTGGYLFYMRRDLLEEYLRASGEVLFIACTGARLVPPDNDDQRFDGGWLIKP